MSASMAIPPPALDVRESHTKTAAASSSPSSTYSTSPSSPGMPQLAQSPPASPSPSPSQKRKMPQTRRQSLLGSALRQEESSVINIAGPDGPPRLISYLTSSQGFTWNPEIFIPSYVDHEYVPLENRREPVHDIILSDEEIRAIYPS